MNIENQCNNGNIFQKTIKYEEFAFMVFPLLLFRRILIGERLLPAFFSRPWLERERWIASGGPNCILCKYLILSAPVETQIFPTVTWQANVGIYRLLGMALYTKTIIFLYRLFLITPPLPFSPSLMFSFFEHFFFNHALSFFLSFFWSIFCAAWFCFNVFLFFDVFFFTFVYCIFIHST